MVLLLLMNTVKLCNVFTDARDCCVNSHMLSILISEVSLYTIKQKFCKNNSHNRDVINLTHHSCTYLYLLHIFSLSQFLWLIFLFIFLGATAEE